jgi:hypothetical protein
MANKITVILEALGFDKAANSVKGFRQSIADADGVTNKFKAGASSAMASVSANAGALAVTGGAALVAFGVKAVGAFTDTAKAAVDLSKATGLSTEEASRWIAVGDDYQVTAEQLTSGLGRIGKTLNDTKWAEYGIATRDAGGNARATNDILVDTLTMLSGVTNETDRARIGNDLFGKGYANLAPLIGHTADQYKEMLGAVEDGQVVTDKEAEKAERFRLAQDALSDALQEVTLRVGEMVAEMAPAIEAASALFGGLTKLGDIKLPGTEMTLWTGSIGGATEAWDGLSGKIETGFKEDTIIDARNTMAEFAAETKEAEAASQDAAGGLEAYAKVMAGLADEIREAIRVQEEFYNAQRAATDANFAARQATDEVTKSILEYDQKVKDANGDLFKLHDIQEDTRAAALDMADANVKVAEETAKMTGETLTAGDKQRIFLQSMIDSAAFMNGEQRLAIVDYISTLSGIPPEVVSEILADPNQGSVDKANQIMDDTAAPGGEKRIADIEVHADTSQAETDIDDLDGRTVTVYAHVKPTGASASVIGARGGFAEGGRVGRTGAYVVGEEGPEIVNLRAGDYVTPNDAIPRGKSGDTIIHTSTGGAKDAPVAQDEGPTPEEAKRAADEAAREAVEREDRIQAAMFETGDISLEAYRKYLEGRQASTEKYSEDWMAAWRTLRELRNEEQRQAEEAAQADLKRQEEAAQASLDRIRRAYEEAKALRELQEAERDVADAMDDIREAEEDLWDVASDKDSDAEDRARAEEGVARAIERAAEEMFEGAGARASANGLARGSTEWARFVRAEVEQAMKDFPQLAGVLGQLLVGVPNLASGGIVKARAGGTLIRAGEAGRDEAVVPLGSDLMGPRVVNNWHISAPLTDTNKLARQLREILTQDDRRNGRPRAA